MSTVSKPAPMRLTMPRLGSAATTRSVIGAYCSRIARQSRAAAITSSSERHCAVASSTFAAAKISRSCAMSGKSLSAKRTLGIGRERRRSKRPGAWSAVTHGTWPRPQWSSGQANLPAAAPRKAIIGAPEPKSARAARHVRPSPDAQAPANHHRRKPAQAGLARDAQRAVGSVEARRRRARRGQARRGAARAARPGGGGHRHRQRRRADAPAFRHDVHRRSRRRRLRAQAHGAHPEPLRRRRAGRRRPGRPTAVRSTSTTPGSCATRRRARSSTRCRGR